MHRSHDLRCQPRTAVGKKGTHRRVVSLVGNRKTRRILPALFGVILLNSGCVALSAPQARPTIQELTGPIVPGGDVTISGLNFGAASHDIVLKVSNGHVTVSQDGNFSQIPVSGLWEKPGSPWAKRLSIAPEKPVPHLRMIAGAYPHEQNLLFRGVGKSYSGYLNPLIGTDFKQLFIAWTLELSQDPNRAGGSNKFIRVWDDTNGKGTRISWTQMHMTYNGGGPSWGGWSGQVGAPNAMTLWVDGKKGQIVATTNGEVEHAVSNFSKVDNNKGLNIKLLGFDPNYGERYTDLRLAIDDLYVSTTRARVVLSPHDEWKDSATASNIQMPLSWSDTSITFKYDPEDQEPGPRYLYVVNAAGFANAEGFRLPLPDTSRRVTQSSLEE